MIMKSYIKLWLFLLTLCMEVAANGQTFEPELPPEPNAKHKITLYASPQEGGSVYGSGSYRIGTNVWIETYPRENYQFKHWLHNGSIYTTDQSFYYTVSNTDDSFTAVYQYIPPESIEFKPELPGEPGSSEEYNNPKHILYLESDPPGNCSFNISSGQKFAQGVGVYLYVYLSDKYKFLGWYSGNTLVSSSREFYYTMGASDITLTAKAEFTPSRSSRPASPAAH